MAMYLGTRRNPKNLIAFPYKSGILQNGGTHFGVNYTVSNDGVITLNGGASTAVAWNELDMNVPIEEGKTYTISGAYGAKGAAYWRVHIEMFTADGTYLQTEYQMDSTVTFTAPKGTAYGKAYLHAGIGHTFNNQVFKPMLNEGEKAEPYMIGQVGQAVKILAPSINLFDKSGIHSNGWDFSNCSEWEISADKNTIIAKGNITDGTNEYQYAWGWVRPTHIAIANGAKGISLKKGDIITISADFTLIEQGTKSAGVRCYLNDSKNGNNNIAVANEQSISETKKRLTWKFTAIGDGDGYYPCFPINQNKVKIENISVNKVKDYWRIRSGINMGRNPKNLIPFPYANDSHTANGITWTVNNDGTVTINGTATATSTFLLSSKNAFIKPNTQYIFSAVPKEANSNLATFNFYAYIQANKNGAWYKEYGEIGNGTVFTAESDCEFFIHLWVRAGTTVENLTFKPMLNEGTKALPYYYYD